MIKEFRKKFKVHDLTLFENESWLVSVRPTQITLGSLILSVKHEIFSLSDINEKQSIDFFSSCTKVEKLLSETFKPDKYNYLALMMVDPIVHFHVIPRYKKTLNFKNEQYEDIFWPKPIDILYDCGACPDEVYKIIKTNLGQI